MKQKFANALSLALIVAMLLTSVALADNLKDDVVVGGNDTITAGGSTTIKYWIQSTGSGTGPGGCDAADGSSATVTINVPSGVTATPSSLTFSACNTNSEANPNNTQSVVLSSLAAGNYDISASVTDSTGTYNTSNAVFTLHVNAPPNTAPSVSVSGVSNGASYDKGSVPTAMCDVIDAEDGNSSFAATLSAVTGPYASDGIGSQTASCSYTDGGGLQASASATYNIVDPSAPSIGYTLSPASPDGDNGWYKGNVTLTWNVTEVESPNSLSKTGCVDQNITADQAEASYSCSATSAGGSSELVTVSIKRDGTMPSISASRTPVANAFGWNNSAVTASYNASDALSGLASDATGSFLFDQEGAGQSHTFVVADMAGNSASATVSNVNIDLTAPTASATASPGANGFGWNNTDVTVSFSGTDALSGIDTCSDAVTFSNEGAGQLASGTCTDKAGNESAAASATVNIDKTAPSVSLVGGPANGGTYYFGFVPAAPTCSASDALSGLDGSCNVSGYSNAIGSHTVTASASDKADNSNSASASYTVLGWTLNGFYQPVDMGTSIFNTVKGGSTVPLKFEIFAGSTELTDTSAVSSLNANRVACTTGALEDAIEVTATGGTSLRYDTTGGQFIYNWKTPTGANTCYKVTMTTADGSSLVAFFKTK